MYRHNASSVKETNDKMFVSQTEKNKWDSKADAIHDHNDRYYTKSEVNSVIDNMYTDVSGEYITTKSVAGFTKDLQVLGNTKQRTSVRKVVPQMHQGGIDSEGQIIPDTDPDHINIYSSRISVKYLDKLFYANGTTMRSCHYSIYDKDDNFIRTVHHVPTDTPDNPEFVIKDFDAAYIRIRHWQYEHENLLLTITTTNLDDFTYVGEKIDEGRYSFDILSRGLNMAKPCRLLTSTLEEPHIREEHRYAAEELIEVKPNTKYVFISKEKHQTKYCVWLDENKNSLGKTGVGSENTIYYTTSPRDAKYVQLYVYSKLYTLDRQNEMVSNVWTFKEQGYGIDVEPYVEYSETIELPMQLHGFDGCHDRLYCENGNLFIEKNIKTIALTGSSTKENWYGVGGQYNDSTIYMQTDYNKFTDVKPSPTKDRFAEVRCNSVESIPAVKLWLTSCTDEGIGQNGRGVIQVRISKKRLNGKTFPDFLKDLYNAGTPWVVSYCTANPETIDLGPVTNYFSLKTFERFTVLTSRNCEVHPVLECKIPNSISSALSSNISKVDEIKAELQALTKIADNGNTDINFKHGVFSVNNSTKGTYINDIKIEGETLVNLLTRDNPDTNFSEQAYTANGDWVVKHDTDITRYKPDTTYTLITYVKSNTLVMKDNDNERSAFGLGKTLNPCCFEEGFYIKNKDLHGVLVHLLKTIPDFTDKRWGLRNQITTECISGELVVNQVLIEGDHRDKLISFFEGMKSVEGDIEVKSVGENILLDGDENILNSTAWSRTYPLDVQVIDGIIYRKSTKVDAEYWVQYVSLKPNTRYETNITVRDISPGLYDEGNIWRYPVLAEQGSQYGTWVNRFTTGSSTKYAAFIYGGKVGNDAVPFTNHLFIREVASVNDEKGNYVKPESSNYTIKLSEPLRAVPGRVKDTIEKVNGEYCVIRRCGVMVIDKNHNWKLVQEQYQPSDTSLISFNNLSTTGKIKHINEDIIPFVCDKFMPLSNKVSGFVKDSIKYHMTDKCLRMAVKRDELETLDVEGFTKWLGDRVITVVYELKEEIIEPLNQDISIRLFDKNTTVSVTSSTLCPTVKGKTTSNLPNSIRTMIEKINYVEKLDGMINKIKLRSMYESYKTNFGVSILSTRNNIMYVDKQEDVFKLLYSIIDEGPHNYNRDIIEEQIDLFTIIGLIDFEVSEYLLDMIESQHISE